MKDADAARRGQVEKWFSWALIVQWYASLAFAWGLPAGSLGFTNDLVHAPTFFIGMLGGICTILPLVAARRWPAQQRTGRAFGICLCIVSLIWLRLDAGGSEMYLLVFACLVSLSLYRDPNLLLAAATLIILHHASCLVFPAMAPPGFSSTMAIQHAIAVLASVFLLGHLIRKQPTPPSSLRSTGLAQFRQPRVLVVDDEPLHRVATAEILKKLGCATDHARTGRDAVDAIAAVKYDAVFMDCDMPALNGYDATVEIRRQERGTHHTWIIALTANDVEDDRDICLVVGMDDYLTKPARVSQIREALRRSPAHRCLPLPIARQTLGRWFASRENANTNPLN